MGKCEGSKFKISRQTRDSFISLETGNKIDKFFESTYKDFGESIIIYPRQLVLANSFEYIKMPDNMVAHLYSRSSISRLGININAIVQPNFVGTITFSIVNGGEHAVELKIGMKIVQLLFANIPENEKIYENKDSKYNLSLQPDVSSINYDNDLSILKEFKNYR